MVPPDTTAPKPKSSGCWVALAVLGGLFVLGGAALSVALYLAATSPEGKAVIGVVTESAKVLGEAASAPGAAEVRAAGCDDAIVLDLHDFQRAIGPLLDAGPAPTDPRKVVVCTVDAPSAAPTCDALARVYVRAAPPAFGELWVQVVPRGRNNDPICAGLYSSAGAPLGAAPHGTHL